jgi:hypothetical protein
MISTVQVAESVETPQTVQTIRDNISKALPQAEQYTIVKFVEYCYKPNQ